MPNLPHVIFLLAILLMGSVKKVIPKVSPKVIVYLSIVTRSWQYPTQTGDVVPEKDFKKLNAYCVMRGAIHPKVNMHGNLGNERYEQGIEHKIENA